MLTLILAAGLLCLLVVYQAHREIIAGTGRGAQAISEIDGAQTELAQASRAVGDSFSADDVALVGPGVDYENDITAASQDLVLAAGNNVAGVEGSSTIQFDEGQLVTYDDLVQQASSDLAANNLTLAGAELKDAHGFLTGGTVSLLTALGHSERTAVQSDIGSLWLRPGDVWWLLLAPFLTMLLLAIGTSYVLWHSFRRLLSVRLTSALMLMLALIALVASLTLHDGQQAKAYYHQGASQARLALAYMPDGPHAGLAYSPWTLAAGLILVGGAAALVIAAFWPRLNEYRYLA